MTSIHSASTTVFFVYVHSSLSIPYLEIVLYLQLEDEPKVDHDPERDQDRAIDQEYALDLERDLYRNFVLWLLSISSPSLLNPRVDQYIYYARDQAYERYADIEQHLDKFLITDHGLDLWFANELASEH